MALQDLVKNMQPELNKAYAQASIEGNALPIVLVVEKYNAQFMDLYGIDMVTYMNLEPELERQIREFRLYPQGTPPAYPPKSKEKMNGALVVGVTIVSLAVLLLIVKKVSK